MQNRGEEKECLQCCISSWWCLAVQMLVCMLVAPSHAPPLQLTEARRTDGEWRGGGSKEEAEGVVQEAREGEWWDVDEGVVYDWR